MLYEQRFVAVGRNDSVTCLKDIVLYEQRFVMQASVAVLYEQR